MKVEMGQISERAISHATNLTELFAPPEQMKNLQEQSREWPSWTLTARQLCDLELLLNGGFPPLQGFLSKADYERVCFEMRLVNGSLWLIPIVLDIDEKMARSFSAGSWVALRDPEGMMLAALRVEDMWQPDRIAEAEAVYGTASTEHPGVEFLLGRTHPWYVGGQILGVHLPTHYDFRALRLTPAELRAEFSRCGWQRVVGFQTRNPMHRAHQELTLRAAKAIKANLLLHPSVGMTQPADIDYYTRVRCYQLLLSKYPPGMVILSLLPLAMRIAEPCEPLLHAIIRNNHDYTQFFVGPDHASPICPSSGSAFYGPHEAQELMRRYEHELGIGMVPFMTMVNLVHRRSYAPENEVPSGARTFGISGTELRQYLNKGSEIPDWFTFSEIFKELRRSSPPRQKQGLTLFLTGLSGAGKSTIANVLRVKFLEMGGRPVTLLDGDIVRKHLSSDLGFSKQHRDLNIRRIGFVASEVTKNGGIAICAPIAPYDAVRKEVREMIQSGGGFVLIYLSTPLEICEKRDHKGLYAKARAGLIKEFTGISDPYEPPRDAEIVIDTTNISPEDAAQKVILYLQQEGFVDVS